MKKYLFTALLFCFAPFLVHNFHVSYAKLAIEQNLAVMNVRFFVDDLTLALQRAHRLDTFQLAATAFADSLYLAYFNRHFELHNNGQRLYPVILSSGIDKDMWWYQMLFSSASAFQNLSIKNTLLFDLFDDQKNILQIMHFPSEKTASFYFIHSAAQYHFACP